MVPGRFGGRFGQRPGGRLRIVKQALRKLDDALAGEPDAQPVPQPAAPHTAVAGKGFQFGFKLSPTPGRSDLTRGLKIESEVTRAEHSQKRNQPERPATKTLPDTVPRKSLFWNPISSAPRITK
jgi:hypothetical protein